MASGFASSDVGTCAGQVVVLLTRRPDVMGALVNRSLTTAAAWSSPGW